MVTLESPRFQTEHLKFDGPDKHWDSDHGLLVKVAGWISEVRKFQDHEKSAIQNGADLTGSLAHRAAQNSLIAEGDLIFLEIQRQKIDISPVGLSLEAFLQEITVLKYSHQLTHGQLMSEAESNHILSLVFAGK